MLTSQDGRSNTSSNSVHRERFPLFFEIIQITHKCPVYLGRVHPLNSTLHREIVVSVN